MFGELQSLKHAAVGGVELLTGGPPWLEDFRQMICYERDNAAKADPRHNCPKCKKVDWGRWATNYDYQPTAEEISDPVYWVVFPSKMQTPDVLGGPSFPLTVLLRRSEYEALKTSNSYVFYKTYFRPCSHSFDWETLAALMQSGLKQVDRVGSIIAELAKSGFKFVDVHGFKKPVIHRVAVTAVLEDRAEAYLLPRSYGHALYQLPGLSTVGPEGLEAVKAAILAANELCEAGLNDQEHARRYFGLENIKFNWLAPEEITIEKRLK